MSGPSHFESVISDVIRLDERIFCSVKLAEVTWFHVRRSRQSSHNETQLQTCHGKTCRSCQKKDWWVGLQQSFFWNDTDYTARIGLASVKAVENNFIVGVIFKEGLAGSNI